MVVVARSVRLVLLAALVAACSPVVSPGASTTTPTPMPSASSPPQALSLVGLGDSVPGAGDANSPTFRCEACVSYVVRYGELAATALGRPVNVTNLATDDGVGSHLLLERIRTYGGYRTPIAAADIITLTIGTNDWQGPCDWPGDEACWAAGTASVPRDIDAILTEIEALRDGRPTAIRVTTYWDSFIGLNVNLTGAGDPNGGMPQVFLDFFRPALEAFNASICGVAEKHHAICVDLHTPFNGPQHDQDAAGLLLADHGHPNQAGHDLIAAKIAEAGFAPFGQ